MTTFVRRIPAEFQDLYTVLDVPAPSNPPVQPVIAIPPPGLPPPGLREGYMERDLGAVSPVEAVRHERPKGFASVAGKVSGQRKDQPYCFAPYDGLRGLGMPEAPRDDGADDEDQYEGVGQMPPPAYPGGPIVPLGETPAQKQEPAVLRAIPYVIGVVGLLWLFNKTAKEMTPPRPAR